MMIQIGKNLQTTVVGVAILVLVGVMYSKDPTIDVAKIIGAVSGIGFILTSDAWRKGGTT